MHSSGDLPRKLGLFDSVAIIVGTIIGAGIFLVPNLVARSLPSTPWIVAVWIFTGGPALGKAVGIALIAAVTAVNYRGVTLGAATQNVFTTMKVAGLAVLIGAAFFGGHRAPPPSPRGEITLAGFGVAMIACLTS